MNIQTLPVEQLVADPDQPRRTWHELEEIELTNSLLNIGQLVPVIVVRVDDNSYFIIDGERRVRSVKRAKLPFVKAVVWDSMPSPSELLISQLSLNCLRSDLSPLERAESYQRLMALEKITGSELAKRLGISKGSVTRYLSHPNLCDEAKALLQEGKLSSSKAYAVSRMDLEEQKEVLRNAETLSRDDFERKARKSKIAQSARPSMRNLRYELPNCTLAMKAAKGITIDGLIDALCDLLRACRRAKSENLDLATIALVLRDKTRASQCTQLNPSNPTD